LANLLTAFFELAWEGARVTQLQ